MKDELAPLIEGPDGLAADCARIYGRNSKSVAKMVRSLLARRARQTAQDLRALKEEMWAVDHRRAVLARKKEVEGLSDAEEAEAESVAIRLGEYPLRQKALERTLETIKVLLVVVTRLDAPATALDGPDRAVAAVLERVVRGQPVNAGDQKLLALYARKHFGTLRPDIEAETGISLLTWDPRDQPEA